MDNDERDESITEARISGTSSRALAKLHGCSSREVEAAVDRRLDFEVDQKLRLRAIRLDLVRIETLMAPFFERAVKDKDCAAGTLCCKLLERRALLLGLDQPVQSRVDVYQVQAEEQPTSFSRLHEMILRIGKGDGDGADAVGALSNSGAEEPSH